MPTTETKQRGFTENWPTIKKNLYRCYVAFVWLAMIANAYAKMMIPFVAFCFLFMLIILESALDKIATAIRTQRNFHIIGDANEINLKGSSLYADSVSIRDRKESFAPVEGRQ